MRAVKMAQEVGGLADALEDRNAAEQLVAWINTEKADSPETNKDYRVTLRQFGKLASDDDDVDEIPESIEWVPGGYPSNYDPAPDPGDMLRWEEDILPMIDACANLRDRALIALAWDLGPRPYELFDLTPKQVSDQVPRRLRGRAHGTTAPTVSTPVKASPSATTSRPATRGSTWARSRSRHTSRTRL